MTISAPRIWLDGSIVATNTATSPIMGHALQRGSLVFDTGSFHDTPRGPALFRAREHVARFRRSAGIVGLELRFSDDDLVRAAVTVVRENGLREGILRWSLFLATGVPDLLPKDLATHVAVGAQVLDTPPKPSIAVCVFDDARKASAAVLPPEAKVSAAYLGPMLAKRRAVAEGADEVVLLDEAGHIAEAPTSNAFAVIGGTLWTPPLGGILPGITRDSVLAIARSEGIAVREEHLSKDGFAYADEAFLSGTSLPIVAIRRINERDLAAPGPVTERIADLVAAAHRGQLPGREEWLTYSA